MRGKINRERSRNTRGVPVDFMESSHKPTICPHQPIFKAAEDAVYFVVFGLHVCSKPSFDFHKNNDDCSVFPPITSNNRCDILFLLFEPHFNTWTIIAILGEEKRGTIEIRYVGKDLEANQWFCRIFQVFINLKTVLILKSIKSRSWNWMNRP